MNHENKQLKELGFTQQTIMELEAELGDKRDTGVFKNALDSAEKKNGRPRHIKEDKTSISTRVTKKLVLEEIEKCKGFVSVACQKIGLNLIQFNRWKANDPEFKRQLDELSFAADEKIIDVVETKLLKAIERNSLKAIMFFLETRGKKRGYSRRSEITGADGESIKTETLFKDVTNQLENYSTEQLLQMRKILEVPQEQHQNQQEDDDNKM